MPQCKSFLWVLQPYKLFKLWQFLERYLFLPKIHCTTTVLLLLLSYKKIHCILSSHCSRSQTSCCLCISALILFSTSLRLALIKTEAVVISFLHVAHEMDLCSTDQWRNYSVSHYCCLFLFVVCAISSNQSIILTLLRQLICLKFEIGAPSVSNL